MFQENSIHFWLIPIVCFIAVFFLVLPPLYEHYTVTIPEAKEDLEIIRTMSCDGIRMLTAENYVSVPENRKYLRDTLEKCAEIESDYKKRLKTVYDNGSDEKKLDAGFTFDLYDGWQHPDMQFVPDKEFLHDERLKQIKPVLLEIPENLRTDTSVNLPHLYLTNYVNNTIIFKNNDLVEHWFDDDHGEWHVGIMQPGETYTITIPIGNYTYSNHPNHQGYIQVIPGPFD